MNQTLLDQYFQKSNKSEQALMTWASNLTATERRELYDSLWQAGYEMEALELEEDFSN